MDFVLDEGGVCLVGKKNAFVSVRNGVAVLVSWLFGSWEVWLMWKLSMVK